MRSPEQRFVAEALAFVGCPYIWGGRGASVWTPTGLKPHDFGGPVVDCSGLILCALELANGPDWRATWNAQRLLDEGVERECPPNQFGTLHFYGKSRSEIVHVAIALDNGLMLESAGGNHLTTRPSLLAKVRVGFESRQDFQEAGRLPLDRLLKTT